VCPPKNCVLHASSNPEESNLKKRCSVILFRSRSISVPTTEVANSFDYLIGLTERRPLLYSMRRDFGPIADSCAFLIRSRGLFSSHN
jgi:hypothetical protein